MALNDKKREVCFFFIIIIRIFVILRSIKKKKKKMLSFIGKIRDKFLDICTCMVFFKYTDGIKKVRSIGFVLSKKVYCHYIVLFLQNYYIFTYGVLDLEGKFESCFDRRFFFFFINYDGFCFRLQQRIH